MKDVYFVVVTIMSIDFQFRYEEYTQGSLNFRRMFRSHSELLKRMDPLKIVT